MVEVGEEFYLDWSKDILQVWEMRKSGLVVASMRKGIDLEHRFPAVGVVEVGKNFYRLAAGELGLDGYYDGGHCRSVSHFLNRSKLLCVSSGHLGVNPGNYRDIHRVKLEDTIVYDQLRDSLNYLPKDVVEEFCSEHNLRVQDYLPQ